MLTLINFFRRLLLLILVSQSIISIKAQQTVTSIYGDTGGFFQSSISSKNTYRDSNKLLGFTVDGIVYSTGVNDATLTSNGITYTDGNFLAFPMPANISYSSTELVGIGTNWGGVSQNNGANDFIKTFSPIVPSFFVRDGKKGLELSSNFFNIKQQVITYEAIVINQAVSINDAEPDIIVTQTGAPSSKSDKFKFIDSNGDVVGNELNVVFNGVDIVSGTDWTIYSINPSTGSVVGAFGINTYRDLRVITFRLSDFGITTTNFSQISNFVHTISGTTDIAFTAYNSDSVEISYNSTDLEVSNSTITADNFCAPTTATFTTTVTNNSTEVSKDFEVDFQIPSSSTATGSSASFSQSGVPLSNASYSGLERKWTIIELFPGESVTLTVNTTVSSAPFPISFTATANILFQDDSNLVNNTETISETGNDSDCDGVSDINDLDDDNDGILDTDEYGETFCYDATLESSTDVVNPNNILGNPDGNFGEVNSNGNIFTLDFGKIYPAGTQYRVVWKRRPGSGGTAIMVLSESTDNTSYTLHPNPPETSQDTAPETDLVTSNVAFRYIRVTKSNPPSVTDFWIDAIGVSCPLIIDTDGDGIPNHLDLDSDGDQCPDALEAGGTVSSSQLDSDYRITGAVNGNGVPVLAAAGSGSGQSKGNSQISGVRTCDTTDTDNDGYINIVDLDDDNDGILDTNEGTGNPDADTFTNDLDTDSDADGCPDALEGGASFTYADLDIDNRLTGGVDTNGIPIVATASGQTIGSSQNNAIQTANCSLLPVIISQVYQTASGNAIELTNIGATTANNIRVALFKNIGSSSPNGVVPTATLQITSLAAGNSVIIKSVSSLPSVTIINSPSEILNAGITDIAGGNDTVILSTTADNTSWTNRYDVVSNINEESSFVRIDEITKANTTYRASEWIHFMNDVIPVLGDTNPIPATTRHANAPLLSEVKTPNGQANNGLGLHRINPTIRVSGAWSNGYPDKSRSVIIKETYEHSGGLNARKLEVQGTSVLTVSNNPLIVVNNNNINTNAAIRILGTGQFIQIHEGVSDVSGSGKLLISQKSELPNTYRYNYWSSPVVEFANGTTYRVSKILKDAGGELTASSTINNIDFITGFDGASANPIKISNYWIWAFFNKATRDDWVQLKETSYLNRGLGFTMKSTGVNPQYFTFSGSPIDGDITFGINGNTTSLLGNPYTGTLDGHAFILNNEDSTTGTLYFWEHSGESTDFGHSKFGYEGGYAQLTFSMATAANSLVNGIAGLTSSYTYNTPSRYIAVGQGFFVTSDTDGGTIVFSNKQRSYQATKPYFFKENSKSKTTDKLSIVKLGIDFTNRNGLTIHRQLGVSFNNKHSFNFDYGYESEMIDVQPTDAYWSFEEMDYEKLVIAGVEAVKDSLKVPIIFTIDSDEPVFLRIDEIKNTQNKIYLYDAVQKTSKELSTNTAIKLELSKGIYKDRFFVTFNNHTTLSTNSNVLEKDLNIYINDKTNKISIPNKANLYIEKVEAFNLLGQKIKTWTLNKHSKNIELQAGNLKTSIYLMKVKSKNKIIVKKILKQ